MGFFYEKKAGLWVSLLGSLEFKSFLFHSNYSFLKVHLYAAQRCMLCIALLDSSRQDLYIMTFGKNTMPFLAGLRLDSRLGRVVLCVTSLYLVWFYKKRWDFFHLCSFLIFSSIFSQESAKNQLLRLCFVLKLKV